MDNSTILNQATNLPMYNFTPEDLIQYLYNETSTEKTAAIKAALRSDWSLREKMEMLSSAHQQLETMPLLSPRKQTIDNILNYAERSVEELSAHS
ncbi:MAG: hypothetical protein JWQ27_1382 [Ferruginibacter sp.]|nr:hypothetical protein [Ferruginibacter sp.]